MATVYEEQAKVFKALCDERRLRILELLHGGEKCACVLIEEMDDQGRGMGYSGGYMRVHVSGSQPGQLLTARITGVEGDGLTGEIEA